MIILQPLGALAAQDSVSIYFRTGATALDAVQTHYLDSLLYADAINTQKAISIIGYADEPGTTPLNNTIAVQRAGAVKAYLLASGVDPANIVVCKGLGNRAHTGEDMHQRRTDILSGKVALATRLESTKKVAVDTPKRKRSLRDLKTMKPGELMVLENLQFKVSTNVFEPESLPILKELAEVLQDFPGVSIRLEGHICCGGKVDSAHRLAVGYQLSLSRAQAVLEYLLAHKISGSRLSCAGFGFSRPKVFPERSLQDSYLNRRVEIRIVSNK
jgi:outer membrane protein OmpA-like peptidoglycan-associated protein